ncbi:MAG: aminoacyl-tRNA hydrolase [Candidatus Paceibacterota bacterium]|jgi:PTH1 family peptidyl-tRNA hydrolase
MDEKANIKLRAIIGLGNPSEEYQNTYHNTGKELINFFVDSQKFEKPSGKHFEFIRSANDLILIKSLLYMNESGKAVLEAIKYFKLKPKELAIAHDDSDVTIGNYKISFDQSSGGHKGIQSIIDAIGTQKFWRIKIGIRPQNEKVRQKAEKFVLKKISKKDKIILNEVFKKIENDLHF